MCENGSTPKLSPVNHYLRHTNAWPDEVNSMPEHTMSLTLDVARNDSTIIVHCYGKLVAGVDDILYRTVKPLLPDAKRVVLDLTHLTRVDSMGLGVLVRLYVSARAAGCKFELINLDKQIRMLIKTANLTAAFSIIGEHGIKLG